MEPATKYLFRLACIEYEAEQWNHLYVNEFHDGIHRVNHPQIIDGSALTYSNKVFVLLLLFVFFS